MHKSRLGALVIDCRTEDLFGAAGFWGAALGRGHEETGNQTNPKYVRLDSDDIPVILQRVDHPSRVHVDIETDDIEAEVQRLSTIGATVVERLDRWVVMEAPSGHRFCVINPVSDDFEQKANRW